MDTDNKSEIKTPKKVKDNAFSTHILASQDSSTVLEAFEQLMPVKPSIDDFTIPKKLDASITSEARAYATHRINLHSPKNEKHLNIRAKQWTLFFVAAASFVLIFALSLILISSHYKEKAEANSLVLAEKAIVVEHLLSWNDIEIEEEAFLLDTEIECLSIEISELKVQ
jgi:hypothetical protein